MYSVRYSQTFADRLDTPPFNAMRNTIEDKVTLVLHAPYGACKSERLKYKWTRKRSAHIDKRYRLIFKVCQECERDNQQEPNHMVNCMPCGVPLTTVNFLDITDHYALM